MSSFPDVRLRRFRRTGGLRGLVRETRLSLDQFVMPLFVAPEALRDEALPAMSRRTVDGTVREVEELVRLGVRAVILFGIPEDKDEEATGAWDDDGIVQQALRALRPRVPRARPAHRRLPVRVHVARPLRRRRRRRGRTTTAALELLARTAVSATSRPAPTSSRRAT